jgi:hypothetical protein
MQAPQNDDVIDGVECSRQVQKNWGGIFAIIDSL